MKLFRGVEERKTSGGGVWPDGCSARNGVGGPKSTERGSRGWIHGWGSRCIGDHPGLIRNGKTVCLFSLYF